MYRKEKSLIWVFTINTNFQVDDILQLIANGEDEHTEFKAHPDPRGLAETICAFLNTDGGIILVGVDDRGRLVGVNRRKALEQLTIALGSIYPHPKVKKSFIKIGDKEIMVIRVDKSDKIHSYRNLVYVRVGASNRPLSIEELIEKATESLVMRFDELPAPAPISAINEDLVREFLEKREQIRGIKFRGSIRENMRLLKIITIKNGKEVPTNAGLLFFSDNPQEWLPQAKVHLIWFADENMTHYTDSRFFDGPIWKIVDNIEDYFYKNLRRIGGELIGWKRVEILEYPIRALREAIINAIIHRNYADPSEVKVFILPNKIIIRNPGGFPPGVTPDNPIHKPRNPLLAQYMYDIGYIEKYGYGIKMMKEECEKHPLVKLKFNTRPYVTEVIFQKTLKTNIIDELDKKILELLKEHGELTSGELATMTKTSKPTILKRIKKLIGLGLVDQKGQGPAKRYYIKKLG